MPESSMARARMTPRSIAAAWLVVALTAAGSLTMSDDSSAARVVERADSSDTRSDRSTSISKGSRATRDAVWVPAQASAPATTPQIFSAASEWRRDVSDAPVAKGSAALVANLSDQVTDHWNGVAAFNFDAYNVSLYTVDSQTPRVDVMWDNCQNLPYVPAQLYEPEYGAVFSGVPIPDNAVPAAGTDGELSIWDPTTDQLWELWIAHREPDGWHACWGGRIDNVSKSVGTFPEPTGVAATGLSITGGAILLSDVLAGSIKHAMNLNIIYAADRSLFSYPALRSDGQLPAGTPHAIREGQRFRLDPTVDLDALDLTPIGKMIAKAAQKYGFIVNDRGGAVAVITESGLPAQQATGRNPWKALMDGVPGYEIMANFPWKKLQALPVDYGKP